MYVRGAIASLALIASGSVAAQKSARPESEVKVVSDITRCRAISDVTRRLACYDEAVGALADATEKRIVVVLDRSEVQRTRRSLFGFTLPKLPFFGNDKDDDERADKAAMRELDTKIVSVSAAGYGLWSMTLVEGGTWRTTQASRTLTPKAGGNITIKRGLVGGYLATVDGQRGVRVQRVG